MVFPFVFTVLVVWIFWRLFYFPLTNSRGCDIKASKCEIRVCLRFCIRMRIKDEVVVALMAGDGGWVIGKCACAWDISFVGYANYMICLSFSLVSNSRVWRVHNFRVSFYIRSRSPYIIFNVNGFILPLFVCSSSRTVCICIPYLFVHLIESKAKRYGDLFLELMNSVNRIISPFKWERKYFGVVICIYPQ